MAIDRLLEQVPIRSVVLNPERMLDPDHSPPLVCQIVELEQKLRSSEHVVDRVNLCLGKILILLSLMVLHDLFVEDLVVTIDSLIFISVADIISQEQKNEVTDGVEEEMTLPGELDLEKEIEEIKETDERVVKQQTKLTKTRMMDRTPFVLSTVTEIIALADSKVTIAD